MVKDIMACLDGTAAVELRLAAVDVIATLFQGQIIGLYLNTLPPAVPVDADLSGAARGAELLERAREAGDRTEAVLAKRLARFNKPVEIRRFDILADDISNIAGREARSADAFVAIRPNGSQAPDRLIEGVLFGSGRHLVLIPEAERQRPTFDHVIVAWNCSRESARALAEAMPYLHAAKQVTVVVVNYEQPAEQQSVLGKEAVNHLEHHGINAALHRARTRDRDVGAKLIAEPERQAADLIVMGAYGHHRLTERLLGGVTYSLIHESPVPLLIAH